MSEATVVLGFEDQAIQDEVLHFLDRMPRVRVVGAESDGAALARRLRQEQADAAVVSPPVLRGAPELDGAKLLVVVERETTEALRTAIRAGARGFYLWPEERDSLARDAERASRPATSGGSAGTVVAVCAARGGAGATFLATHLAAGCAAAGASTALVDCDVLGADITAAIGAPPEARTVVDLAAVVEELAPEHLERVSHRHPSGFFAILAPHDAAIAPAVSPADLARIAGALRTQHEVVILHVPVALGGAMELAAAADRLLLVVTLDVLAFRSAKRILGRLADEGLAARSGIVVNRAARAEIVPADVERVFGAPPVAVIPRDRRVLRAQNRGELLPARSGAAGRRIRSLAERIVEGSRS